MNTDRELSLKDEDIIRDLTIFSQRLDSDNEIERILIRNSANNILDRWNKIRKIN